MLKQFKHAFPEMIGAQDQAQEVLATLTELAEFNQQAHHLYIRPAHQRIIVQAVTSLKRRIENKEFV